MYYYKGTRKLWQHNPQNPSGSKHGSQPTRSDFPISQFPDIARQIAKRPIENRAEAATWNPRGLRFSHLNVDCCGHHFSSSRVPFHNLVLLANRRLSRCCQDLCLQRGPGGLSRRRLREANASRGCRHAKPSVHPSQGRGPARVGLGWP